MRRALVRFLLLGSLLFVASRSLGWEDGEVPRPDVRTDDEVLVDEALRQGLDAHDPVIQRRLVENRRFLGEVERFLDLRAEDPVVRRRLVNLLRLRLAEGDGPLVPSEAALSAALASRAAVLRTPAHVTFTQGPAPGAPALPLATRFDGQTGEMIARSFGPAFAREVMALAPGGPPQVVRSVHGLHLVRVERRDEERLPPVASVRTQLHAALTAEAAAERVRAGLAMLRRRNPGAGAGTR